MVQPAHAFNGVEVELIAPNDREALFAILKAPLPFQ